MAQKKGDHALNNIIQGVWASESLSKELFKAEYIF